MTEEEIYTELKSLSTEFLAGRMETIKTEKAAAIEEGRPMNPMISFGLEYTALPDEVNEVLNDWFNKRLAPYIKMHKESTLHAVAAFLHKRGIH